jgi:hypothetical protein
MNILTFKGQGVFFLPIVFTQIISSACIPNNILTKLHAII